MSPSRGLVTASGRSKGSVDVSERHFFLGGHDLEMVTIRDLLERERAAFHDAGLGWGVKASSYREEIGAALARNVTPVLVELPDDLGLGERAIHVDHHNERSSSDAATSLHQVFRLLGLPPEQWTRRFELVAANDRGWIPEMRASGATEDEIRNIRAEDRKAQGVTTEDERIAEAACQDAERLLSPPLTIIRLPGKRTSPVIDRLAFGERRTPDVLVLSHAVSDPSTLTEVNFSGDPYLVERLAQRFGGWHGLGFWGHGEPVPAEQQLIAAIAEGENERAQSDHRRS